MKRNILKILSCVVFIVTLTSSLSAAERLVVNIPFDFHFGGVSLTAGTYKIAINGSLVHVIPADGRNGVVSNSSAGSGAKSSAKNVLVFNRSGDEYFLSEVIRAGDDSGRKLPQANFEIELAGSKPVRVVKVAQPTR